MQGSSYKVKTTCFPVSSTRRSGYLVALRDRGISILCGPAHCRPHAHTSDLEPRRHVQLPALVHIHRHHTNYFRAGRLLFRPHDQTERRARLSFEQGKLPQARAAAGASRGLSTKIEIDADSIVIGRTTRNRTQRSSCRISLLSSARDDTLNRQLRNDNGNASTMTKIKTTPRLLPTTRLVALIANAAL